MPWHSARSDECPDARPWAVIKDDDGSVVACHESEESAEAQVRALYANEPGMASGEMQHKTFELIETKADGDEGQFSALASVFGNIDRAGDRMLPGSFKNTLQRWRESGKPIPVILSHNWDDPHKYVGEADPRAVFENDRGLLVQGKMYMEEDLGRKVYELMKRGILTGWSFGYQVKDQKRKNGANEISEVELFEVGPTLVGANPDAQLQDIKSALGVLEPETSTQEQGPNEEPSPVKSRPQSALKERSLSASLETLGDGVEVKKQPPPPEPEENPELDYWTLKKRSQAAVLDELSEGAITR